MIRTELLEAFAPATPGSELLETIRGICSWQQEPSKWIGGRSACYLPPPGLARAVGVGAVKFKGLGLSAGATTPAQPPSNQLYDRWPNQEPDDHFGIGPDGEFLLAGGDPAPLGGLLMGGAAREIRCAEELSKCTRASILPLALFAYPERHLASVPGSTGMLGVAVTGTRTASTERCSALVPGWSPDSPTAPGVLAHSAVLLGFETPGSTGVCRRLQMLAEAYRRFGRALRAFAEAGWYRYSGHPGNIQLDDEGDVLLPDLDSSRPMRELTEDLAALEAVRDGMSGLYNLACTFFRPGVMDAVGDETLRVAEPFSAFLDGWDPGSPGTNDRAAAAIVDYVIESRARLRKFEPFLRDGSDAGEHLYRFVRHDRDLTFIWLFRQLFRRRKRRPLGPNTALSLDELDERLLRFAGRPRFDVMMALERRAGLSDA